MLFSWLNFLAKIASSARAACASSYFFNSKMNAFHKGLQTGQGNNALVSRQRKVRGHGARNFKKCLLQKLQAGRPCVVFAKSALSIFRLSSSPAVFGQIFKEG